MRNMTLLPALFAAAVLVGTMARAEDPTADTVVATVNGTDITLGQMIALRDTLPAQYLQLDDKTLFDGILDQLVQQTALAADAKPTKKDELTLQNQRMGYLAGTVLEATAEGAISDDALKAAYDAKYGTTDPAKEFHAAHILVPTEDEAKAIKAELDGGADFATVAKEKSTGPSGPNGGDLGWFSAGMMVKPFEDAVMALAVDQVSDPVQTEFGWHVIKLYETRDASVPTLDEAKDELTGDLRQKAVEARVKEVTDTAKVEKMTDGIDPAVIKSDKIFDN
ncbi:peptidyl-prolyl cis-trans isomerase C [Defluviimonas denitrificans]|uniref:Parvulin-like PPIase n=1 Tax=Albidovulum denitrificans TaxID=404881 RepID=A0A2S8S8R7_9RHOB|nr:peptidylprolyl isomerase [Defluviimonas denitrificans]PQV57221.1 peptidyl-prolyl cis-trans isomerase C [Defluviimonas denitrificans]